MNATFNYLKSTGQMIEATLQTLEPETVADISGLIAAGAMIQVQSAWSRSGHVETTIVLIHPCGERVELAALDLVSPRIMS